ncbi:MAG: HAD family hydrolase [Actinomycetota bacterium]
MHRTARQLRGLVTDWGGVLTTGLQDSLAAWAESDGVDWDHYLQAMRDLLGPDAVTQARVNPVHALERGEIEVPHFEQLLAARLRRHDGAPVEPDGLLARMFTAFEHAEDMYRVVRRARRQGLRTALLSNSWGNAYPVHLWDGLFDAVVISGEVGLRKPEPEIYRLAAERLRLAPEECVFVDDLTVNVQGAVAVGMVGVRHTSYHETRAELEALFGVPLGAG